MGGTVFCQKHLKHSCDKNCNLNSVDKCINYLLYWSFARSISHFNIGFSDTEIAFVYVLEWLCHTNWLIKEERTSERNDVVPYAFSLTYSCLFCLQ